MTRQIAEALGEIHSHSMVHLDLKPGNIMMAKGVRPVLIDFGLAKQFDDDGNPESSTTIGGGSPGYAPIEQSNYNRDTDRSVPVTMDIYALGATMYKMLTGRRAPEASKVLIDGFPEADLDAVGVSSALKAVVKKAMSPIPKDRYQSAAELLTALPKGSAPITLDEETVVDEPKPAPAPKPKSKPTPTIDKPTKPKSRKKWLIPLILCLIALVGVGVYILVGGKKWDAATTESAIAEKVVEPTVSVTVNPTTGMKTFDVEGVKFNMVYVKGGTFKMGATAEQSNGYTPDSDEYPVHSETLSDYYIGETEVTQELWCAVMMKEDCKMPAWKSEWGFGDKYPAYDISYDDCRTFINKLNDMTKANFRMPSEAEWEYAARGGSKSRGYIFSGSNNPDNVAWYWDNSGERTHEVKAKAPNELGIYDMSGNVDEWCSDWYGDYHGGSQSTNIRVARGGSWYIDASFCRVAIRNLYRPGASLSYLGLRLAL